MKQLPGLTIILGGFVLWALGLFILSFQDNGRVLPAPDRWTEVEKIRQELRSRSLSIDAGKSERRPISRYDILIERLPDSTRFARYVVRFRPIREVMGVAVKEDRSILDVGFVDSQPNQKFGNVRVVAFRRYRPNW